MAKAKLVTRLADRFGTSVQRAQRFVDDVGPAKARQLERAANQGAAPTRFVDDGTRVVDDTATAADDSGAFLDDFPTKGALAGTGVAAAGAGGLYYREQDVRSAEADAEETSSTEEAINTIFSKDLDPDERNKALEALLGANTADDGGGGPVDGLGDFLSGLGDAIPNLDLTQVAIVLLVIGLGWVIVSSQTKGALVSAGQGGVPV